MKEEEIIAEAIRRYPIGTMVNSTGGCANQEVTNHEFYWDGDQLRSNCNCAVYSKRYSKWAMIIKAGEEQIKYDDCILGEIYHSNEAGGYIMRHDPGQANNLHINVKRYYHNSGYFGGSGHKIRLATPEERAWFIACEKARGYVPKECIKSSEIINQYEIY